MARRVTTTCPMDCPDTCALEVTVGTAGIERIGAGEGHPDTGGYICRKVSRFGRRMSHPERLLHPMRRVGAKGEGRFERVSWDQALETIADRLRAIAAAYGGEAILPFHYGGSNGLLTDGFLDEAFFARLGASRLARTLCAVPTTQVAVGMYGKMPGVAFEDFVEARCIVVWGANPKVSNIHLVPYLKEAKRRGARIVTVDPTRNHSPREIDLHLPVYPGTDLPVALALIRRWNAAGQLDRAFLAQHAVGLDTLLERADAWPLDRAADVAGVPAADLARLADWYAEAEPAVLRCGWGLERNRNGGQAVAAVLALPALLGKFGVRGGGYTLSNNGAARFDRERVLGSPRWDTRIVNMTRLGEVLSGSLEPPIKSLFVYNCNPAATVPDQNRVLAGLAREDLFTVVFEQVATDTVPYADVVLPATTFLEHADVRIGYGSYVVAGTRPVVSPAGEARSNAEVFAALGRAMGWTDGPFGWEPASYLRRVADGVVLAGGAAADAERLEAGGVQRYDFPGPTPVQFVTVFPGTDDGKIHLVPEQLGDRPFAFRPLEDDRYPLALVSPASHKMISSTLGEFNFPELTVELHPEDAARRGVADGETVRVHNALGEVICRAVVHDRVRPGVVRMHKGAWRRASRNGRTATALCPADVQTVGGGACYNDARVQVERWAGGREGAG